MSRRSKSARRARARAAAALEARPEWGDASLLLDDDDQLKRAAEAFLAGARERERASEMPTASPERPVSAGGADPVGIEATGGDGEPAPIGVGIGDAGRGGDRRERRHRAVPGTAPAAILDGAAWDDVVRHEAARWQRHGGSVAVLAVRLARRRTTVSPTWGRNEPAATADPLSDDPQAPARYAVPLGDVLRHRARASDPVARVAEDQFSVLLLEADEDGASAYAERIRAICEPWVTAVPGDLALRIAWAVPALGGSVEVAAEHALASVGGPAT